MDCGPWTRSSAARLDVPRGNSWVWDRVARAGRTRSWPRHTSGIQQRIFWPVHLYARREAIVAGAVTSSPPQAFQPGTLAPSFNVLSSYLPVNPLASCLCSATTCKSKAGFVHAAVAVQSLPSRLILSSYLPFNPSASCLCSATTCKSTLMAIASMCELVVCVGRDCGPWTRSSAARLDVQRVAPWSSCVDQYSSVVTPRCCARPKTVGVCAVCPAHKFLVQVLLAVTVLCHLHQVVSFDREEASTEPFPTEQVAEDKRLPLLACAASFANRS